MQKELGRYLLPVFRKKIQNCPPLKKNPPKIFQVLLALGPFCSNPLRVTLTDCITNSSNDISIDTYAHSVIPVMKQFGLYDRDSIKFEIKINKRGAAPGGGGEVLLTMPNPKKLRPAVAFGK